MFPILQLASLLFMFSKVTGENIGCDPGWVVGESTCYYFSDTKQDNDGAQVACSLLGAQLVQITSMQENDFITQHSDDTSLITRGYWIQGSDTVKEDSFIYEDGTPITFFHWYRTEPDNRFEQDCIALRHSYRTEMLPERQWFDRPCDEPIFYICESAKQVSIVLETTVPGSTVPGTTVPGSIVPGSTVPGSTTPVPLHTFQMEKQVAIPAELFGRYSRSYGTLGIRIPNTIRCGVICDMTAKCVGYTPTDDGYCVLLDSACTTSNDLPCYDRSLQ